jgi:hypothetical protein
LWAAAQLKKVRKICKSKVKCLKANGHLLKGAPAKIDADSFVWTDFATRVLNEEFRKIEELSWKDVMDGSESAGGRA